MATRMQLEIFWREIAWRTASCEEEQLKSQYKRQWKAEIVSISGLANVLGFDCHTHKFGM